MEEIIIWGAGRAAAKRHEWATFAGYQVVFFVDNDDEKWGRRIQGIPVYSPQILKEYQQTILIPDSYRREIEEQLIEISYQGKIIGFDQFKKEIFWGKEFNIDLSWVRIGAETTFVFDSYFTGLNWGGVESWSCMVSNQLLDLGTETQVICGPNKKFDQCTKNCLHFSNEDELETIKEMVVKIAAFLPCIFITHGSIALYAAQIVKSFFPDQIKLVAVAHGDEGNTYRYLQFWSVRLDKIICISQKIWTKLQDRYGVTKNKLLYRPNPIPIPPQAGRRIHPDGVLRIGFAARLMKAVKRVHLLPEIIEACFAKEQNVEFNIAGEGDCLELLLSYISDHHLENKVHVLGFVPPTEMVDFWMRQDIYLNISDYEGMSLTMLEAMACGAVPVVTDVSGVSDLIENGKNGFVVPVDSWLETADKIESLSRNREMLQIASNYNMNLISEKCDIVDYAKWLIETFCS